MGYYYAWNMYCGKTPISNLIIFKGKLLHFVLFFSPIFLAYINRELFELAEVHSFLKPCLKNKLSLDVFTSQTENIPYGFDKSADLLRKRQNHEGDLCVLLKKSEL